MEKKEPILTTSESDKDKKVTAKVDDIATVDSENKKEEKNKTTEKNDVSKKKSIKKIILIVAGVIIIGVALYFIFTREARNVASIKNGRVISKNSKESKGFLKGLFSAKSKKEKIVLPAFDIVRMEKGEAVIAGTAGVGAEVFITDNNKLLGSEKADENGQWVFIPKKPLAVGNRKLSLYIVKDGKKIYAKQSAVLHVSRKSNDEVALLVGGKKSKVLKAPKGENIGALRVAKIDYNEEGSFNVEGLAVKNSKVNIYMNNQFVQTVETNEFGIFTLSTKYEIQSGKAQVIRADMLSSKGRVLRRVAYKFTPVFYEGANDMTVIKKGDCLWNIAFREYGRGSLYVILFEANKSQIKDPNKIYVGQVFSVIKKDSNTYKEFKDRIKKEMKRK